MPGRALTLLAIAVIAPPASADPAAVQRTYLERAAISAADQACDLFSEGERLALKSGLYQSEGELLRANEDPRKIARLTREVSIHAKSLGCAHPDVVSVAATVRASYRQFAKTAFLEYPAAHSTWGASRSGHDAWAVMQTDKATGIAFGLRRDPNNAEAVNLAISMPAKGSSPSSVQLLLRDPGKMPEPWFGSLLGKTAVLTAAPKSISFVEWAGKVRDAKNAVGDGIWVYSFSPTAIERLEQLDPREAIQFDLIPSQRAKDQSVKRVTFEVGDIRAAHAFAMIPKPEYAPTPETAAPVAH